MQAEHASLGPPETQPANHPASACCSAPDGWLELSLHVTGGAAAAIQLPPAPADSSGGAIKAGCTDLTKQDSAASLKASDADSCSGGSVKDASEAEGEGTQLLAGRGLRTASPFFWSLLR